MQISEIISELKTFSNIEYNMDKATNKLTIVGYFNRLSEIKANLFNNSDYAIITRRQDGKYNLTALIRN